MPGPSQVLEELAEQLSQAIASEGILRHLLKDFHCPEKDRRNHLVKILVFIGGRAAPGLLEAYATSDNQSVRLSAFEAMRRIGASALEPFLARLSSLEQDGKVICHIFTVLSDRGDASLAPPLRRFLHHGNGHIREAALRAYSKLQGPGAEQSCLEALRDRDDGVHHTAVACLAHIRSRHPQAMECYAKALQREAPAGVSENEALLIHMSQTLASFADLSEEDSCKAEQILLAALRPVEQKGVLRWLKKPSPRHSERVRVAICEALASVGTSEAVGLLSHVAETGPGPVAEKAAAAVRHIQDRASRKTSAA